MSTAPPPEPTPSPLPLRPAKNDDEEANGSTQFTTGREGERPTPKPPQPKLRLHIEDVMHKGAVLFFQHMVATDALTDAVTMVRQQLYMDWKDMPPVRSITLVLKSFEGVAYTRGTDLDDDHKEIHFSLDYIGGLLKSNPTRVRNEIFGVLVHEMVHVWQWNGKGTCPGGLIEGVADFVRLRAGLDPPHWRRAKGHEWDAGYERTAYFLDWLERTHGVGSVVKMNLALKDKQYDEEKYWGNLFGTSVKKLWERYQNQLED